MTELSELSQETLAHGLFRIVFKAMGTPCEITYQCDSTKDATEFQEHSLAWVRRFEKRYSRYLPDSLISSINQAAGSGQAIPIEEEDDREDIIVEIGSLLATPRGARDVV